MIWGSAPFRNLPAFKGIKTEAGRRLSTLRRSGISPLLRGLRLTPHCVATLLHSSGTSPLLRGLRLFIGFDDGTDEFQNLPIFKRIKLPSCDTIFPYRANFRTAPWINRSRDTFDVMLLRYPAFRPSGSQKKTFCRIACFTLSQSVW